MATATRTVHGLPAYAALVRVPNLFTAPPDVLLGVALASLVWSGIDPFVVVGLALASVLLYAGGTTLNDYADADEDARERPTRPIPSGSVSRSAAGRLAAACLLAGVLVAGAVAGPLAGGVALLLAAVVVAYDFRLKGRPAGFVAMGTARGLNVCLGIASVGSLVDPSSFLQVAAAALATPTGLVFLAPLVTALYIVAVTLMAADETRGGSRAQVRIAAAGAAIAAVAAPAIVFVLVRPALAALALGLTFVFAVWVGRPLRRAYATPRPDTVGPAVGACVLGLVVFDAALASVAGPLWALVVLAHLVPARVLAERFSVS